MTFDDFECYIVHYTGHTDRKKFMQNQLAKEGLVCTFVEKYDREEITYQMACSNFIWTLNEYMKRSHMYFGFAGFMMKPEELSLNLKHKEAMRMFLEDSNKQYMLVLEDDAILCHNFKKTINSYLSTLPSDWDAAFIGQGAGKRIPQHMIVSNIHWYRKDYPSDRCTDSILFTRAEVERIHFHLEQDKIAFPIDHELSYLFRKMQSNVYWLEPPIVAQGSQTGFFDTFQDEMSGKYVDTSISIRDDMESLL